MRAVHLLAHQLRPRLLAGAPGSPSPAPCGDRERETRIALVEPALERVARPRPAATCAAPAPRPTGPAAPSPPRGSPISAARRLTIGCSAAATAGSAKPKASTATTSLRRQGGRDRLTEHHRRHPGEGRGVAREPAGRVRASAPAAACRRRRGGRVSAGCRRARRSSPARAPSRRYRCRARCRTIPAATAAAEPDDEPPGTRPGARGLTGVPSKAFSPRMPSETSSVIGLADQGGAGIEQRLHGPGMPRRHRSAGRPVGIAAAGRRASHVEQVLGREGETGKRPAGAALDTHTRPRYEGADIVFHTERGPPGPLMATTKMRTWRSALHMTMRLFSRRRRCTAAPPAPARAELHAAQPVEPDVDDRRDEQRQELRHHQAADDRDAERLAQLGAGAGAERDRQRAEDRARASSS